jgi:hypothetical protein
MSEVREKRGEGVDQNGGAGTNLGEVRTSGPKTGMRAMRSGARRASRKPVGASDGTKDLLNQLPCL